MDICMDILTDMCMDKRTGVWAQPRSRGHGGKSFFCRLRGKVQNGEREETLFRFFFLLLTHRTRSRSRVCLCFSTFSIVSTLYGMCTDECVHMCADMRADACGQAIRQMSTLSHPTAFFLSNVPSCPRGFIGSSCCLTGEMHTGGSFAS